VGTRTVRSSQSRRFAVPKVQISVAPGEHRTRTESFQLAIDDFEREAHADYAVLLRGRLNHNRVLWPWTGNRSLVN
jgi:hypothetical protein